MTRVLSDANRVTDFFLDGFPYIFVHGFTILATFTVMFRLNWQMALVACILLPLLVFMSVKLKPKLWSLFGRRHRAERAVNNRVNDNLTGSRVVKAFGQQKQEKERFKAPNERLKEKRFWTGILFNHIKGTGRKFSENLNSQSHRNRNN